MSIYKRILPPLITLLCLLLSACATNPVTGESQISFISQDEEIQLGKQQFGPLVQAEGGPYTADPYLNKYVQNVGKKLAKVSDRPDLPYTFIVIDNTEPNAWALPGGKVGINTGLLLQLESEAQLAAVLSHEIVHAAAGHSAQQLQTNSFLTSGVIALGAVTSAVSGGLTGMLSQNTASLGSTLAQQSYSRGAESEADHYGMIYMSRAGYDPKAAVELQELFLRMYEEKDSSWVDGLFSSHPPSQERVAENKKTLQELPQGGVIGKASYQKVIAPLKRRVPAYNDYKKGVKALENKNVPLALNYANKAITMAPQEGKFYALRALSKAYLGDYRSALDDYNTAIKRNPYYFLFYLERGTLYATLKQNSLAKADLQKSQSLLPTEEAAQTLKSL